MPDDLSTFFEGQLYFNGINAITGDYGQPPLSSRELARLIQGAPLPADYRAFVERQKRLADLANVEDRLQRVTDAQFELRAKAEVLQLSDLRFKAQTQTPWPVIPGAGDPTDVANVGWAAIFPSDMHPGLREEIKAAMQPLFDLRREQAGDLFRVLDGTNAYRSDERKDQYFERLGVGPGLADPRELPFYVLLIGTPEQIPYSFQYQLDVMRGVGRLDFGSDVEAYAAYAQTVVAAEQGEIVIPRRVAFWAPNNRGDKATEMSARLLVQPLFDNLVGAASDYGSAEDGRLDLDVPVSYDWDVLAPFTEAMYTTHAHLHDLLGRDPDLVPALLFTASHGIEFPANHPAQMSEQGALLCQDWPGLGSDVLREHYFAAEDVEPGAALSGLMAVFFACYSAGTPQLDQFAAQAFKVREKIAPLSFTAALPQQLLKRGALAVLGHVERAWGYSFISPRGRLDNQAFVTAMRMLMNGDPIGVVTDASFNMRYAEMSSDLSADLDELKWDPSYLSDHELAYRWTANNDARSYVVIGDPAARLPISEPDAESELQPDLGTIGIPGSETAEAADEVAFMAAATVAGPPAPSGESTLGPPPLPTTAAELDESDAGGTEADIAPFPFVTDEVLPEIETTQPETATVRFDEQVWSEAESPTGSVAPVDGSGAALPGVEAVTTPDVVPETPRESPEVDGLAAQAWETARVPFASMEMARPEAAIGYGLEDQFEKLKASLKAFTDQLATSLGNAAEDIVTLDVRTYSTADIVSVADALDTRQEVHATLRALTRVAFDGDLQVYVPEKADQRVNEALWDIHKAMVEEAQRSRAGFLATMAELATRLLDSLKIGI